MSEGFGWLLIFGCFGIMLAIAYVPWYIWALVGIVVIAIVGFVMWIKYGGGVFEGGEEENND